MEYKDKKKNKEKFETVENKEVNESDKDMENEENAEINDSSESIENPENPENLEIVKNKVKMKVVIDEKYNLIFESKSGKKYQGDKLFTELIKENNTSKLAQDIMTLEYSKIFQLEEEIIILARFALNCYFEKDKSITVYSMDHLDLIFKNLGYTNPYYTSKCSENYLPLNDLNSKWEIFIEQKIKIENLIFDKQKADQIFISQNNLIDEYKN